MLEIQLNVYETKLTLVSPNSLVGTGVNYDTCKFTFGEEWTGYTKTAVFYSNTNNEPVAVLLDESGVCTIPWEPLQNPGILNIGVFGVKDNIEIPTNFVMLRVIKGSAGNNVPPPPSLDIYAQILNKIAEIRAEEDAFKVAESTRIANEEIRQQNETTRQNTFSENETARQNAFDSSEIERQNAFNTNENIREENETIRQNNEAVREENEAARIARMEELEQVDAVQFKTRQDKFDASLAEKAKQVDLEIERQRINQLQQIPEGGTTADAALNDIKIGADGITYNSPGDAVRGQINKLKNDLTEQISGTLGISDIEWTVGGCISSTDGLPYVPSANPTNYKYSGYINVKTGDNIPYYIGGLNVTVAIIAAYDADKNYIKPESVYSTSGAGTTKYFEGTYVVSANVAYIRVTIITTASVLAQESISIPFTKTESKIENIEADIVQLQTTIEATGIENHWKDKKWVAFGTSITDNWSENAKIDNTTEPTGKYVPYLLELSELSPTTFKNRGIAGGRISGHILYYIRYYTADMADADLITIEGAVNDFAGNVPLGNVGDTVPYTNGLLTDSTDSGSFAGACYCAFKEAMTNAPKATIVLLTETTGKNRVGYTDYSWSRRNGLGLSQNDYIDMTIKVAQYVGIPVIHCGRDSMINASNPNYLADHIHHSYLGGKQYAKVIWQKLKDIPCKITAL
jgi:hypothetical protein